MNTALATNDWSFLSLPQDQFVLDLSRSTFLECVDEYTNFKRKLHPSVVNLTSNIKYHIRHLQDALNIVLMPKQITSVFYSHFISYLQDRGLKSSSITCLVSYIRAILAWASDYNAQVHPSYKSIDVHKVHTEMIALTADEVSRIYHFNLKFNKLGGVKRGHSRQRRMLLDNLDRVRDMFILGCNLGQRHSDLVRIEKSCFINNKLKILQQKTKNTANVDINRFAIDKTTVYEILEKYNYEAPYKADISNYNKLLHKLMKIVFGNEVVTIQTVSGNMATTKDVPKYKLIASHTARRTFATYNYTIRKYPAIDVMRCTGHSTESSFKKYICGEDE